MASASSKPPRKPSRQQVPATPEPQARPAVELAGIGVRLMAMIYDGLLLVALYAVTSAILIPFGTPKEAALQHEVTVLPDWYRQYVLFPAYLLVTWLFYGYFWKKIGQTLGMQTWRLKVQRFDQRLPGWGDSLVRCIGTLLFPFLCGLASQLFNGSQGAFALSVAVGFLFNYGWMLFNGRGLAWHDQLSRTVVIRLPPEPKSQRRFFAWFSEKND